MPIRISPEIFNIGLDLSINYLKHYDDNLEFLHEDIRDSKKLKRALNDIKDIGFDFICVPISKNENDTSNYSCEFSSKLNYVEHYEIKGSDWNTGIVGRFPAFGNYNLNEVRPLLEWCEYIGYHAIIVTIDQLSIEFLSIISSFIGLVSTGIQIWIELSISDYSSIEKQCNEWQVANTIMNNTSPNTRVGLVLKIDSKSCRSIVMDDFSRFFGEPIKCIAVNSDFFESNHIELTLISELLLELMRGKVPISIYFGDNNGLDIGIKMKSALNNIIKFIKSFPPLSDKQKHEYNYIDILQTPLQPLWIDLKSIEYEVFERDKAKYEKYSSAIKSFLSENPNISNEIRVLIVGSGRGGLVHSVFNAFSCMKKDSFRVLCVEKNRNAVITLKAKIEHSENANWRKVEVIHSDIRTVHLEDRYDLVISELMGSFGDNELSPECLVYAQKFVKPDGIMVPQRYTSYLEPISCRKVWNQACAYSKSNNLEMPFVSRLRSHYKVSKEGPRKVFSFDHPSDQLKENSSSMAFNSINFTSKTNSVLHGFLGYFECKLYKEIGFSTLPCDYTDSLMSWFEFFFPISNPIQLKRFDTITFNIWRKSNQEKVWYEWLVTKPTASFIHNLNGRAYSIRL